MAEDPPQDAIVNNLYSEATLVDASPVYPPMIFNGAVVTDIPVPSGRLVISDFYFNVNFVYWTVEVDRGLGAGYETLATFGFTLIELAITEKINLKSPIVVDGGPGVQVRLKVQAAVAPAAPSEVNATIRSYNLPAIPVTPGRESVVFTLTDLTTTGATEEVLNMSENAGTPALSVPVAAGEVLEITDFQVAAGGGFGTFKLQQTNDGVTWFTIGALQVVGVMFGVAIIATPNVSWQIKGDDGPSVAMRVAITTANGPTPVAAVLSGYRLT